MLPEIESIKIKRKRANLTQKQLARECGVSQSLIAKLESKRIDVSYNIAKKIFLFLDKIESGKQKKCREIMKNPVIYLRKEDSIEKARELMKKNGISQIPVIERGICVGCVNESILLDHFHDKHIEVAKIMQESLPVVDTDMPVDAVIGLVKISDAVLVQEKGKIKGIITKADLI